MLCIHGRTGKFLEPAPGTDGRNLLQMAREGLKTHLASALRRVFEQDAAVPTAEIVCPNLRVRTNGHHQVINLRIRLLHSPPSVQGLALVVFEEVNSETIAVSPLGKSPDVLPVGTTPITDPQGIVSGGLSPTDPEPTDIDTAVHAEYLVKIRNLEHDLQASNDYLKTTVEELETTNEELKSSNEELQSTNEELQSINEEHETSKEELQSVNEELVTVNDELESKISALAGVNNDMANLFASTEIATLFLGCDLTIKRFTPAVVQIFNLIQTDVGRPLKDIAGNIDYPNLVEDARGVLDSLIPRIKEASTREGRWYKVRILPYRTTENKIDGVVLTFIDISDQKVLEAKSRLATVVRDSYDAITVIGFDGHLLAWNRGAERIYGLTEAEAVGFSVFSLYSDRQHEEIRQLLSRISSGDTIKPFRMVRELRNGRQIAVRVTATALRDAQGNPQAVATTEHEDTEPERHPYDALKLVRGLPIPVVIEDANGILIDLNDAAEHLFGGAQDRSMIGLPSATLLPRDDLPETKELLSRCLKGEKIHRLPGRRLVRDGSFRRVVLSMLLVDDQSGVIATVIDEATSACEK